jgi:hypothetical protein
MSIIDTVSAPLREFLLKDFKPNLCCMINTYAECKECGFISCVECCCLAGGHYASIMHDHYSSCKRLVWLDKRKLK